MPAGLKWLVIGMGVILVAGMVVLFSTIIYRTVKPGGDAPAPAAANVAPPEPFALALAPGEIKSIALDGNRIAIQTANEIILVDMRRRKILSRLKLNAR